MLSCKELVARSSDFLDGQLDFRGQLAVRSHLLMCRHCRRFIRQMRLTQATVRHLPEGPGPELDRLAAHLSELRKDAARRWAGVPSTPSRRPRFVGGGFFVSAIRRGRTGPGLAWAALSSA